MILFNISDISNLDKIDLSYFNRINNYNKKRIYHFLEINNQKIESGIKYLTPYFSNDESQLDVRFIKNSLFLISPFFIKKFSTSIIPLICSKNQKSHPVLI